MSQQVMKQSRYQIGLVVLLALMVFDDTELNSGKKKTRCKEIGTVASEDFKKIEKYVSSYNLPKELYKDFIDKIAFVADIHKRIPLDLLFMAYEDEIMEKSKLFLNNNGPWVLGSMLLDDEIKCGSLNLIERIGFQYPVLEKKDFIKRFATFCGKLTPTVTSLDLTWNDLYKLDGDSLVEVFHLLPSAVTFLDLSWNNLHRLKVSELKQLFKSLPSAVTTLDMEGNFFSNEALEYLRTLSGIKLVL